MRYYPAPFDDDKVRWWLERNLANYAERGHSLWALILKKDGTFVGECGPWVQHIEQLGDEQIELGWHVHKNHVRKGYASEAAEASRDWAFANLDVDRLISLIRPENEPSWRTATKIGMTPGERIVYKDMPHVVYEIKASTRVGGTR